MRIAAFAVLLALSLPGQENFYRFAIERDRLAGAPDFSWLNRPLRAADRLFVCGAHFCRVGPDLEPGTRDDEQVRLFGTNAVFGGNFPEEADAVRIARRLRRLGVNVLRLHHMDTSPDRDPQQARSVLTTDPYPTLNPVSVRRLRR
ncbi:MAG: capsular biosynthesis protein, partial [Bryobacteraceae bacterium]